MNPKFCPGCGSAIAPHTSYCPECDHHFGRSHFTLPLILIFLCVVAGVMILAFHSRTSNTSTAISTSSQGADRYDASPFTALKWCDFLSHRQFYIAEVDSEGAPWSVCCRGLKVEYRTRDDCIHQCMLVDFDRYKMKGILPEWSK